MRKNDKKIVVDYENCIKKSNAISMAKLNQGLTLNQMQLLAYAIYSTQKDGKTEFIKADFEKKFRIEYKTKHAKEDAKKIFDLAFSTEDLESDYFDFLRFFQRIKYKNGLFSFKWTDDVIPHILELKEKYVTTDLNVTSKFKSEFSWILYDFLKAHYGYWRKDVSKKGLMKLFGVEDRKSYLNNTSLFKKRVLDVAINELKKHTELDVWYKEVKKGRAITGFELYWSTGEKVASATKKQINTLKSILETIYDDMLHYINLNDEKLRNEAIDLIREAEQMRLYVTQTPISITNERADRLIADANYILLQLEAIKRKDGKDNLLEYNWLED